MLWVNVFKLVDIQVCKVILGLLDVDLFVVVGVGIDNIVILDQVQICLLSDLGYVLIVFFVMSSVVVLGLLEVLGFQVDINMLVLLVLLVFDLMIMLVSIGLLEVICGWISKGGEQLMLVIGVVVNDLILVVVVNIVVDQLCDVGIVVIVLVLDLVMFYYDVLNDNWVDVIVGWC